MPDRTSTSGSEFNIAHSILRFFEKESLHDQPVFVANADGTNANVGSNNGSIHNLEMVLGSHRIMVSVSFMKMNSLLRLH